MSIIEIVGIVFLYLFSITCFAVGIIFGAWWHFGIGTMTILLSWAIYQEDKPKKSH